MPLHPEPIDPRAYRSLPHLIDDAALQFKSETALIEANRDKETQRLSYIDFRKETQRVAAFLRDAGVGIGDRVAIVMTNQSRWLIGAQGAMTLGATLVPLDYKLNASEQLQLLRHSRPKALLTEHGLMRRFDEAPAPTILVSECRPESYRTAVHCWDSLPTAPDTIAVAELDEDAVATIVYSSGTGGRAKGCMLSHRAYLSQLAALMDIFPMRPGHRYFSILPTNHAIDFMVGFVGPFSCGATVVHQKTLRPEFLKSTMKRYRITHMALVPMILAALADGIRDQLESRPAWLQRLTAGLGGLNEMLTAGRPNPGLSRRLLGPIHTAFGGHLELLFCGGAFVDRARAEELYRLGLPVVIGYGLTEACTVATVNDLKPFRADSVGRTLRGVELKIHDPGPDGVGEVWLRGPTIMEGYFEDPDLTAETINAEGWLMTGDLGWLDGAHHLHLVGRSKNMIVTAGGKNVYPENVESAFESVEAEELAVFASGFLWPRHSELQDEHLIAVIRPRAQTTDTEARDIHGIVRELNERNRRLPDYKRIRTVLPFAEAFPRTASMKIKRGALADAIRSRCSPSELRELSL